MFNSSLVLGISKFYAMYSKQSSMEGNKQHYRNIKR